MKSKKDHFVISPIFRIQKSPQLKKKKSLRCQHFLENKMTFPNPDINCIS